MSIWDTIGSLIVGAGEVIINKETNGGAFKSLRAPHPTAEHVKKWFVMLTDRTTTLSAERVTVSNGTIWFMTGKAVVATFKADDVIGFTSTP